MKRRWLLRLFLLSPHSGLTMSPGSHDLGYPYLWVFGAHTKHPIRRIPTSASEVPDAGSSDALPPRKDLRPHLPPQEVAHLLADVRTRSRRLSSQLRNSFFTSVKERGHTYGSMLLHGSLGVIRPDPLGTQTSAPKMAGSSHLRVIFMGSVGHIKSFKHAYYLQFRGCKCLLNQLLCGHQPRLARPWFPIKYGIQYIV